MLAAALTTTACGGSPSDQGGATRTTDAPAPRSDLFEKLPGAAALGDGYRLRANSFTEPVDPYDPATTTTTTALKGNTIDRSCPGARWPSLDAHPDVEGVEYVRFVAPDEREITVGLAPLPPALDRAGMDRLLRAITECGTITDDHGFAAVTIALHAEEVPDLGDYGIAITMSTDISAKGEADPMGPGSSLTYLFVVGDTLAAVRAESGFDLDHLKTVPPDDALVPRVAETVADRLRN